MKPLNRIALVTAVLAVCAGAAMVGSATVVNAATAGGKCSKVGQTQRGLAQLGSAPRVI